jgi:hypothetical protein
MRRLVPASLMLVAIVAATMLRAASPDAAPGRPQYTSDNQLMPPIDYREWIFLSSGLGMSYSATPGHEMFTNVFVPQWAYQEFLKSGKWPDKTMFVVEDRYATSKGSINKAGHYQSDSMGIGVEVKDETRFPDKWAYFNFDENTKSASANPKSRMLELSRRACSGRARLCAVLSDAETGREEIRNLPRIRRKSGVETRLAPSSAAE